MEVNCLAFWDKKPAAAAAAVTTRLISVHYRSRLSCNMIFGNSRSLTHMDSR